jgi:hypothetical protein
MSLKLLALALSISLLTNRSIAADSSQAAKPAKKSTPATSTVKPDDERTKRGKAMLSLAEAEAGGLEDEMRAYALLQAARAYAVFDSSKARELLDQAYTASQVNHEESPSKMRLVQQILVNMAQMVPERAEALLPYAPENIRAAVLNALLRQYLKKRDVEHAKDMVLQLSREGEFPYGAASQLMAALPKENSTDRQAIFGAALTAFKAATPGARSRGMALVGHALGDLVVRFWRDLPTPLVKEAIDALLDEAEKQSQESQSGRIMVATAKKSSNFNSIYEYQAQKLLPVLREIDESEGKRLAEKLKQLNPSLDPEAGSPLSSERAAGRGREEPGDELNFEMVGMNGPNVSANASAKFMQMRRAMAIQSLAVSKPQEALAQAAALEPEPRSMALEGIARVTAQRDANIARKALDQLTDSVKAVEVEAQARHLTNAAEIYLRMHDKASATRAIERGAEAAEKLYERDSDKDAGNQALKVYWPSSGAWKRLIRFATRISEDFAVSLVNDISDPEIRATQRLALAAEWLGVPPDGTVTIVSQKGKPTQVMMEMGDDDGEGEIAEELSQN